MADEDGKQDTVELLLFDAVADLADKALLLVDPRTKDILRASTAARRLLAETGQTDVHNLQQWLEMGEVGEQLMLTALATDQPIIFGTQLRGAGTKLTVKAQRFDHGKRYPLLLMSVGLDNKLSRRFQSLTDQLQLMNREIRRRVASEQTLASNLRAVRRALDIVRQFAEIDTTKPDYMHIAAEAISVALRASGSALIIQATSNYQCVATTGILRGEIALGGSMGLSATSLHKCWTDDLSDRNSMLIDAVVHAANVGLDSHIAKVLPITVAGRPKGALVWFADPPGVDDHTTDFETEIMCDALGNLIGRADMERRLIHSQKMEALGQMTGGIAHDFNNLLAVTHGNAELLLDTVSPAEAELALSIKEAAQRGAKLNAHLLAFGRKQFLRPASTSITEVLHNFETVLRRTMESDIELRVKVEAGLWFAVLDRDQLQSALFNLASNARDAMPTGGTLTIESKNATFENGFSDGSGTLAPGEYVMISCRDDGKGMDEDTVAQAFTPFFTLKEVGKGSGLGLSMVFGFVEQSGGHVRILSEPGKGTSVQMFFPRDVGEEAGAGRADKQESGTVVEGRGHILLVEDDAAVLRYTARTLSVLGYSVDPVAHGKDAIALLDENTYDLLLTDVVLPGGLNGWNVAEHARKVAPDMPVLFMSGHTQGTINARGKFSKNIELLNKPFSRQQLGEKLHQMIASD